jgi:hypothetical protein
VHITTEFVNLNTAQGGLFDTTLCDKIVDEFGATEVIVELIHFRLKIWQHLTSLMNGFAHFVTLHQLKQ